LRTVSSTFCSLLYLPSLRYFIAVQMNWDSNQNNNNKLVFIIVHAFTFIEILISSYVFKLLSSIPSFPATGLVVINSLLFLFICDCLNFYFNFKGQCFSDM
jgi:hypothetical protein